MSEPAAALRKLGEVMKLSAEQRRDWQREVARAYVGACRHASDATRRLSAAYAALPPEGDPEATV